LGRIIKSVVIAKRTIDPQKIEVIDEATIARSTSVILDRAVSYSVSPAKVESLLVCFVCDSNYRNFNLPQLFLYGAIRDHPKHLSQM
jgi:hypothetical protein